MSTEYDTDVWINRVTTYNGTDYYKYMLVYVNDVIHLSKDSQKDMLELNQVYLFKGYFGQPDKYLGANVDTFQLEDGSTFWSMNCVEYLYVAIKNLD